MTIETKSNLSHIFRQHDLRLNQDQANQIEQAPALKPFSLRPIPATSTFVANSPFALQIDEII